MPYLQGGKYGRNLVYVEKVCPQMENSGDPYGTLKIYWLTGLTITYGPMNTSLSPKNASQYYH